MHGHKRQININISRLARLYIAISVYACVQQYQLCGSGNWALEELDIPESQQQRWTFCRNPTKYAMFDPEIKISRNDFKTHNHYFKYQ